MPEPIVIITVLSLVVGFCALAAAALHTWRYESHRAAGDKAERR